MTIHRITPPATDSSKTQVDAVLTDLIAMAKTLGTSPSFQGTTSFSVDLIRSQQPIERIANAVDRGAATRKVEIVQHRCDATIDLQSAAQIIAETENADLP